MATKRKRPSARTTRKPSRAPSRKRAAAPGRGPIRGVHAMFYSSEAGALRLFLRDKLGFSATDVGEGWLIFDVRESDLGVHPTEGDPPSGTADISFYCDDIHAAVKALAARGVEFTGPVADHGYGFVTHFRAPGGFDVQLYQPKYAK